MVQEMTYPESIFWGILCMLEGNDGMIPHDKMLAAEARVKEACELYEFRLKTTAPVFALRYAIINLTTPPADTALNRRDTRAVP